MLLFLAWNWIRQAITSQKVTRPISEGFPVLCFFNAEKWDQRTVISCVLLRSTSYSNGSTTIENSSSPSFSSFCIQEYSISNLTVLLFLFLNSFTYNFLSRISQTVRLSLSILRGGSLGQSTSDNFLRWLSMQGCSSPISALLLNFLYFCIFEESLMRVIFLSDQQWPMFFFCLLMEALVGAMFSRLHSSLPIYRLLTRLGSSFWLISAREVETLAWDFRDWRYFNCPYIWELSFAFTQKASWDFFFLRQSRLQPLSFAVFAQLVLLMIIFQFQMGAQTVKNIIKREERDRRK